MFPIAIFFNYINQNINYAIEAPRSKLRGIFDPQYGILFLCSLTPPQAAGNALAGIQLAGILRCVK